MSLDSNGERVRVERIENAVLPMASAALTAGQVETARRLYTRLLEVDPESADARLGLGDVALANRETAQAASWYLAAVTYADRPETRHAALLAHGRAALAIGDLDAARSSFARLTTADENASLADIAWGFNGIGIVNLLEGNTRDALAAMEQAVLRRPNEPMFQTNLDRALRITANYPPEEHATKRASSAEVDPDPPPIANPASEPATLTDILAEAAPDPPPIADPASEPQSETDTPIDVRPARRLPSTKPEPATEAAPEAPPSPKPAGEPQPERADLASPAAQEFAAFLPRAFVVRTDEGMYLQVGAYAGEARATSMASRLRGMTDLPIRVNADAGDSLFRVQVGPLPSGRLTAGLAAALRLDGDALAAVDAGSDATPEPRQPAETPFHVIENGFAFVEVGRDPDYNRAAALASETELRTGHPVEVSKVRLAGTPAVYRVRVGPVDADVAPSLVKTLAEPR